MADPNATLVYTGDFDGSKIVSGLQRVDEGFLETEKISQKAFDGVAEAGAHASKVIVESHEKMEHAAHHHAEIFSLSHREIRRTLNEGMAATMLSTELTEKGFLTARGAVEGFNLALMASMASGPAAAMMLIGTAVSFAANKYEELKKASRDVSWFGDIEQIDKMNEALERVYKASEENSKQANPFKRFWNEFGLGDFFDAKVALMKIDNSTLGAMESAYGGKEKLQKSLTDLKEYSVELREANQGIHDIENSSAIRKAAVELQISQIGDDSLKKLRAQNAERIEEMQDHHDKLREQQAAMASQTKILDIQAVVVGSEGGAEGEKAKREIEKKRAEIQEKYQVLEEEIAAGETVLASKWQEFANDEMDAAKKKQLDLQLFLDQSAVEMDRKQEQDLKQSLAEFQQLRKTDDQLNEEAETNKYERERLQQKKHFDEMSAAYSASLQKGLITKKQYDDRMAAMDQARANSENKINLDIAQSSISIASSMFGNLMGLYKKHGEAFKFFAEAKNAVDTATGAMAAFAAAQDLGWPMGPIVGAASAATVVAMGVKTAGEIAGVGFADGGYTGAGANNEVAGAVHRNEVVWSAGDVSRAGGVAAVESMRTGGGGGSVHLGDTHVHITGNISPSEAREIGTQIGNAKYDRLRQLKRDIKEMDYLNISE